MTHDMKVRCGYGVPPTLELSLLQRNGLRISGGHETPRWLYIMPHMSLVSLASFHGFWPRNRERRKLYLGMVTYASTSQHSGGLGKFEASLGY